MEKNIIILTLSGLMFATFLFMCIFMARSEFLYEKCDLIIEINEGLENKINNLTKEIKLLEEENIELQMKNYDCNLNFELCNFELKTKQSELYN